MLSHQITNGELVINHIKAKYSLKPAGQDPESDAILQDFADFINSTGFDILELSVFLNEANLTIHSILLNPGLQVK